MIASWAGILIVSGSRLKSYFSRVQWILEIIPKSNLHGHAAAIASIPCSMWLRLDIRVVPRLWMVCRNFDKSGGAVGYSLRITSTRGRRRRAIPMWITSRARGPESVLYPAHAMIRNFVGFMIRKLSVTSSQ